jgi:hypothetical protein
MRRGWVGTVATAIALTGCGGSDSDESIARQARSFEAGLSSEWQGAEPAQASGDLQEFRWTNGEQQLLVGVKPVDVAPRRNATLVRQAVADDLQNQAAQVDYLNVSAPSRITVQDLDGVPAFVFSFKYASKGPGDGFNSRITTIAAVRDGQGYSITLYSPAGSNADLEQVLSGWQWQD